MKLKFYKYQGTGNDFIMVDDRELKFPSTDVGLISHLCHRRFGIGADGLILLQPKVGADFYMQYFNSDGRESSMCGNGGRCIAAFAKELGVINNAATFFAVDGLHEASFENQIVKLKMQNVPMLERRDEHTFVLNTGSPHFVKFILQPLEAFELVAEAKKIRYSDEFKSEGINVNFANLVDLKSISIRTYERGVEDETLSCGTGVTAAALCTAVLNNFTAGVYTVEVKVEGGELKVQFDFDKTATSFSEIWLQGPAQKVYEGTFSIPD